MAARAWESVTIESLLQSGAITGHKDGNHGSQYPRVEEFGSVGVPFLTAKSLSGGNIDIEGAPRLPNDKADKLRLGFVTPGDVLLSHNATVGRVAVVPEFDGRILIGTSLTYFRLNDSVISPRYLAAYFSGADFQNQLAAVMSQTTRNQVPITAQRRLRIVLPPLAEQESIAAVLGALDDKIELNRRMNATQDAMARALFQSWFGDFDPVRAKQEGRAPAGLDEPTAALFSSQFQDSELGEIPQGWEVVPLEAMASIRGGKQLPTEDCLPAGEFTVFGANGVMGYATRATHSGFVIAFGRVGAYCGSIHWSLDGGWINNNATSVIPFRWPEYVLQSMLSIDFHSMRTGSAQPFIPNSSLASAQILCPSPSVAEVFCRSVGPLRRQQADNEEQSRTLAALRDTLLPKLLSGELKCTGDEGANI